MLFRSRDCVSFEVLEVVMIDIGRDFAPYPAGTIPKDGPYNAQAFREHYLIPALRSGGIVQIRMDSARGYASSWLAAAFGGLSRAGFTTSELRG